MKMQTTTVRFIIYFLLAISQVMSKNKIEITFETTFSRCHRVLIVRTIQPL